MRDGDKFYIYFPEIIPINKYEHSAKRYVWSGPEQPLAQRASRQARGVILPTGDPGKQRG